MHKDTDRHRYRHTYTERQIHIDTDRHREQHMSCFPRHHHPTQCQHLCCLSFLLNVKILPLPVGERCTQAQNKGGFPTGPWEPCPPGRGDLENKAAPGPFWVFLFPLYRVAGVKYIRQVTALELLSHPREQNTLGLWLKHAGEQTSLGALLQHP